jgi:hypothetical protein
MPPLRKITLRDKPEALAAAAQSHAAHLREALEVATRRAARSLPLVRELLQSATIEAIDPKLNAKVAVVSFRVPTLKEAWHQLYPWQSLSGVSPRTTATTLAWSLRENIRRHVRDGSLPLA